MSERHEFDIQDPFGTRPDEKPPQGWDEGFWEDVCARIEDHRSDPASSRPPEPPKRDGVPPRAVAIATIMMLMAAAAGLIYNGGAPREPRREPSSPTLVNVSGDGDPAVSVEWTSSGGRRSGYVVLQSSEPDISYVVIDRRLAMPQ